MTRNKYPFEADPFGRAFMEHLDASMAERIAYGLKESAKYRPVDFPESFMLPTIGAMPVNGASYYLSNSGIVYAPNEYDRLIAENPQHRDALTGLCEDIRQVTTWFRVCQNLTPAERRLIDTHACWGGTWIGHGNPDYHRLLHLGTSGIRQLIQDCQMRHPDAQAFYHASLLALDALDIVGDRIAECAAQNAANESNTSKKQEWLRIAETFRRIPREPAYDIYSAVMFFWLFFTFDGIDSPGRLDQAMADFYEKSTEEDNYQMVTRMLEGLHYVRGWNLCISGSDAQGNDETNGLSYLILRRVKEMGYQTPNLTMRVHSKTPQALWDEATECLATGNGLPAIYNDDVVCSALEKIGISVGDAHEYCMNGCNQIDIMGKSHMGLEDGEVNLAKALSLALHGGRDLAQTPLEQLVPPVGNPCDARSFPEFLAFYYRMLDYLTDAATTMANRGQQMFAQFAPNPLRSCVIQGCLEQGRDYKNGGPLYGHGQILAEGIADTADSLWAIKTLVFDTKKYTMSQLVEALEDNFKGHEELWNDFRNCQKFGNDIPALDELCADVVDHFFQHLKGIPTFRGGVFTGGCSPFNRVAVNGQDTHALPNGKRSREANFADSVAAVPGCDTHGPTAALKSMMHYRQRESCSGFVTQLKFHKGLFNTSEGKAAFQVLAKTYFQHGGQQLSINVLDRETLLEAQKHPESFPNLIVRVGGYSEYFLNLTPEVRQNVIDRTEF